MESSQNVPTSSVVALISGHIDLSEIHFRTHYIPQLNAAMSAGHSFILGDAIGLDTRALQYLLASHVSSKYPDIASRITIYLSRHHDNPALQEAGVKIVPSDDPTLQVEQTVVVVPKEGEDDERWHYIQRDANMTAASDYDILYVRTLQENRELYGDSWIPKTSATELNKLRRAELARLGVVRGSMKQK